MTDKETVIVAIPSADDYVWRISSEKVPHMTLLYLGSVSDEDQVQIAQFLEHATSMSLRRFGLSVDRRDTLGPKDADVLFLDGHYELARIKNLRHSLLQNNKISAAYNSAEQFPGWVPHLTLGYPDAPAKEDPRDYPGIHWVNFDRIAMWTGEYEGPEFRLKEDDYGSLDVAMSGFESIQDFLAHHGIKGMKWGVRRTDAQLARSKGGKKSADADEEGSSLSRSDAKKAEAGKDVFISADAERFIKTRMKEGHEMSDREMREAINRAKMAKEYDELFGDAPNSQLKQKVENLKLRKEFAQLDAEMNPSLLTRVGRFKDSLESGWDAYQKLNEATGGKLSDKLKKEFGPALAVGAGRGKK